MPGPVPKRSEQRRRVNKPKVPIATAPGRSTSTPTPDPEWHTIARRWFEALSASGQSEWYQASDWAQAELLAEAMHRLLSSSDRMSGQLLATILQGAGSLLTTEGERRRLQIELARDVVVDEDEDAAVADMARYRAKLGG